MKKLLLSIALAVCGFTASASAADEALCLKMKDGTVHSFLLNEKPVITMGDGKLNVATDMTTATYSLYDVREYVFGTASTAINSVSTSADFSRNGDNIVFHGVDAKNVAVYAANGTAVNAVAVNDGTDTTVSMTSLPSGVYIIKASGISIKVNKK